MNKETNQDVKKLIMSMWNKICNNDIEREIPDSIWIDKRFAREILLKDMIKIISVKMLEEDDVKVYALKKSSRFHRKKKILTFSLKESITFRGKNLNKIDKSMKKISFLCLQDDKQYCVNIHCNMPRLCSDNPCDIIPLDKKFILVHKTKVIHEIDRVFKS